MRKKESKKLGIKENLYIVISRRLAENIVAKYSNAGPDLPVLESTAMMPGNPAQQRKNISKIHFFVLKNMILARNWNKTTLFWVCTENQKMPTIIQLVNSALY